MNIEISIIIPVYNAEKYIGRCLDSILSQTYRNVEIILVDDCSNDSSVSIIKEYQAIDSRIILLRNPVNKGPMRSREFGWKKANGRYIVFSDSDDDFPKDAVAILYNKITSSNYDIVFGGYNVMNLQGESLKKKIVEFAYGTSEYGIYKSLILNKINHSLWAKIFKKELFDGDLMVFDNYRNSEDAIILYQIIGKAKNYSVVSDIVYNYYIVPNSSTQKRLSENQIKNILYSFSLRNRIVAKFPDLSLLLKEREENFIFYLLKHDYDKTMVLQNADVKIKNGLNVTTFWKKYNFFQFLVNSSIFYFHFVRTTTEYIRKTLRMLIKK